MLLPYLTDSLGIAAVAAGFIVFLPKAWDVVLNPIAGRISDRTVDPRGPRRPWLLRAGLSLAVAFALLFAAPSMGSKGAEAAWVLVCFLACATAYGFFQVPYVSMPAELTVVVRRAHPADDLAGGDPRLHDHARRRDRPADPRRRRRPGRLPGDGHRDGGGHRRRRGRRLRRHPARPDRRRPARSRARLRDQLRIVAAARDFRLLLTTFVVQALATGCMLAGVDYMATDVLDRKGATTILFVCFVAPGAAADPGVGGPRRADRQEAGLPDRLASILAAGALLSVLARSAPFGLIVGAVALVGVGYAGAPGLPARHAPRRRGRRRAPDRQLAGRRLHRRLDRRRDARPRARSRAVRARAGRRWLPVEHRRRRRPVGHRPDRDHARLLGAARRCSSWSAWCGSCATRSAPTRWTRPRRESRHERRPRAAQGAPGRRPAGARRPDPGLRLRLGSARRRPDRPRGGRGVRRLQRARPDGVPEPAPDGERPGRLRARPARRTRLRGRHRDLGRHRVGAARGAGRARRAPGRGRAPHGAAGHRARGVPQGRALLRRGAGAGAGRRRLHGRRRGDRGRRSTRPATGPCWWSRARRRTRTASSTRSPSSRRWRPRAGSGATSTRASAAGCCRTPRGSAGRCPRGRSRSRGSPRSRSTCTSTATRPRARRSCCTGRRSCGSRSSSRRRRGRATRC